MIGNTGPTGPGFIDYMVAYSTIVARTNPTSGIPNVIRYNQGPTGTTPSSWTPVNVASYGGPTGSTGTFGIGSGWISGNTGLYQVTYRVDFYAGNNSTFAQGLAATYIALDNQPYAGTGSLVMMPENNHIYAFTNVHLIFYTAGQVLTIVLLTEITAGNPTIGYSPTPVGNQWAVYPVSQANLTIQRIA
jgi:hypothetical protein